LINVEGLSQAEQDRIALYMNYDMVGSPNYIFMVYDADESTFEAPLVNSSTRATTRTTFAEESGGLAHNARA